MPDLSVSDENRALGQSILTIDLGALADNWRQLADLAEDAECAAVVKANGYGLGIEPVSRALSAAGCETFFVAHLSEAEILRKAAPEARIFVLNGLAPAAAKIYARTRLIPVLGSLPEMTEWT